MAPWLPASGSKDEGGNSLAVQAHRVDGQPRPILPRGRYLLLCTSSTVLMDRSLNPSPEAVGGWAGRTGALQPKPRKADADSTPKKVQITQGKNTDESHNETRTFPSPVCLTGAQLGCPTWGARTGLPPLLTDTNISKAARARSDCLPYSFEDTKDQHHYWEHLKTHPTQSPTNS